MASKRTREGDEIQQHICSILLSCMFDESFQELFRRIVREELERSLRRRGPSNQTGTSGVEPFRLCFTNKLHHTYFTNSKIISAERNVAVKIALFDVRSQSIVTAGPLSSLKIEICVLNADFGSNNGTEENWSSDEFNANILIQREGKARLLSGERFITLENGEGFITKMMFTDNSSWLRTGKFRLGAKVEKPSAIQADIKEAISDSFKVKDSRGEARKKHDLPSLDDHVWRLTKIAKDGKIHNWLSSQGIHTVKDLLRRNTINPSLFQKKYGGIPTKSWEAIMEHATACVIDEKELYIYQTAEQQMSLRFNSIFKVVGVALDGQNYCHPDSLTLEQKHLVEKARLHAYNNVNHIVLLDDTPTLNFSKPLASLQAGPSGTAHQGPGQAESFSEDNQEGGGLLQEFGEMLQYSPFTGGDFFSAGLYTEFADGWGLQTPCATPMGQGSTGFYFASGDGAEFSNAQYSCFTNSAVRVANKAKGNKAMWRKIRAALEWVILSVRLRREKLTKVNYC